MKSVAKNTWLIFKRNKEFFYLITIQPIMIFFLMSFLLAYSTTHKITVIHNDVQGVGTEIETALAAIDGIDIIEVDEDEVISKIYGGNIELAVMIGEDGRDDISIVSDGNSEIEKTVRLAVDQVLSGKSGEDEITFSSNEIKAKGMTVSYSLGIMIFKTLTAGNLLAALIIRERNNKMRDRILLSGTGTISYLGGMGLIYLLCMMAGSLIYYLAALVLNFDFGMRNSLGFLLMLFCANVLSVALYLFASTLVKKEDALWFMATFVLLPMALLSGVLFPFHLMPEAVKTIGNLMPQRWIIGGIERMQQSGSIMSGMPNMLLVLGLSLILYILAAKRTADFYRK